jgi:hypothetical protein
MVITESYRGAGSNLEVGAQLRREVPKTFFRGVPPLFGSAPPTLRALFAFVMGTAVYDEMS